MESFLTPYRLSNSGQEKLQFTPFWGGPKPVRSDGLRAGNIESHNFFVLGFILVKFHIRTRLLESFRTIFRRWCSGEEKFQFTPFWGGPKPVCSDGLRTGTIESHNFFCFRSYPGEISHSNSPNRELSNDLSDVVVRRRKVALHTSSHLTPTEV